MKKQIYIVMLATFLGFCTLPTETTKAEENQTMDPGAVTTVQSQMFDPHTVKADGYTETSIIISKDADLSSWTTEDIYPSVEEISFEEGRKVLEPVVFCYFPNVKKIVLPMSLNDVGQAFRPYEYGTDLKDYDYSLKYLSTIEVNPENVDYTSIDDALYTIDQTHLICYPCGKKNYTYTMPQFVTTISDKAFGKNPYLKKIVLGSRFECYDGYDLYGTLPNLKKYSVSEGSIYLSEVDGVLFNYDKTELVSYPRAKIQKSYTIPETVKELGEGAFKGAKIKQLEITADFVLPEYQLYEDFEGSTIEEFLVGPKVTYFATEDGVLYDQKKTQLICWPCKKKVTRLKFASTIKELYIDDSSLPCLDKIQELVIPKNCHYIDYGSNFSSLKTITVEKGNKYFKLKDGLLYRGNELYLITPKATTTVITIPANCEDFNYLMMNQSMPAVKKIIVDGTGFRFPYECFPNLEKFELKKGNKKAAVINQILYSADKKDLIWYPQAKKETSFTVPACVVNMNDNAFYEQKYLKNVTLPKKLQGFDNYYLGTWFVGCKKLEKINVASGNTSLKAVNGVLYSKDMTVMMCYPEGKKDKEYKMPDTVVQFVVSPNMKFTKLTIGAKFDEFMDVRYQGKAFYEQMSQLSTIKVSEKNKRFYAKDNVLYEKIEGDVHLVLYPMGKKNETFTIQENAYDVLNIPMFQKNPYLKNLRTESPYLFVCGKKAYRESDYWLR